MKAKKKMCIRDRAYEDLTAASKQLIRASDVSNLNTAIETVSYTHL